MQTTTEPEKFRDSAGVWRQKNTVDEKEVWSNNQNDQEQQKFHLCGFIAPRDWELLVDTKNSDAVKNCQSAPIIVTWRKKLPTKKCRATLRIVGRRKKVLVGRHWNMKQSRSKAAPPPIGNCLSRRKASGGPLRAWLNAKFLVPF